MTNRATKWVPLILAAIVAGAATVQLNVAVAADECLAKPTGASSAGKHWFYRIDRATKRQCWHLRDGEATASAARPADSARKDAASLTPSTANAHAEWSAASSPPDDDTPRAPEAAAAALSSTNSVSSAAPGSALATRWPNGVNASPPISGLSQQQLFGAAPSAPKASATVTADATPAETPAPNSGNQAPAPVPPVAVSETELTPRTLLLLSLGALALAAFSISVIWARIRSQRQIRMETSQRRGPRWPDDMPEEQVALPWRQPRAEDLDQVRAPALAGAMPRTSQKAINADRDADEVRGAPRRDLSDIEALLARYAGQASD